MNHTEAWKTHFPAAYASAGREVPDPHKAAVPRGEEEAGVGGQRERRNRLGVAVYGLPDCGGVGGRHQAHLPAAGAREERLLRGGLALAARGAPQRERAARVELLQRAAAAVVLLERRCRSHREAAVGRRSLGFRGGAGGGKEGSRTRAGQVAAVLGKRMRDSLRLSLSCGARRL
jgi:hypothetical protein